MTYTCSMNDKILDSFNAETKKLMRGARTLLLNSLDDSMRRGKYGEERIGRHGKSLTKAEYKALSDEVSVGLAKCLLASQSSQSAQWHGTEDISVLANPLVFNDIGVQSFMNNAISAILTPVFPAVVSNAYDMLIDLRTGGIGETFEFDIPSNEIYQWSRGARGFTSYATDQREADTITLNPKPVGTRFDIPWIRIAKAEYDFGMDLFAAMQGWLAYVMGLFARQITDAAIDLNGYDTWAPSFTSENFVKVRSAVEIRNGHVGQVFAMGKETSLMKVLPDGAYVSELISAVGADIVKFGWLPIFKNTPLIELKDAYIPGTYAGKEPVRVLPDGIFFFSSQGQLPILMAIGGGMVTVRKESEGQSDRVTRHTLFTELDMAVNPAPFWGHIEMS